MYNMIDGGQAEKEIRINITGESGSGYSDSASVAPEANKLYPKVILLSNNKGKINLGRAYTGGVNVYFDLVYLDSTISNMQLQAF
jgi:hypothetical protein